MIKNWINNFDIKYWRTSNWSNEIDFVLEIYNKAFEVKYKEKNKISDEKWLSKFLKNYKNFSWKILNKKNFSKNILEIRNKNFLKDKL